MLFINNELPLYVHEIRALCSPYVEQLLSQQPQRLRDKLYLTSSATGDYEGCVDSEDVSADVGLIDLYHTLIDPKARATILSMSSEIFFYFDDHARDVLGYTIDDYKAFLRRSFAYFLLDPVELFRLDGEVLRGATAFFASMMRIIRALFDVEFTFRPTNDPSLAPLVKSLGAHEYQDLIAKTLNELNEMYYIGKNHYIAHSGDTSVVTKRGMPVATIIHCGYMLAHHSMSERGPLYDESIASLAGSLSIHRIRNLNKYTNVDKIPLFLDNSAFELGASAQDDILIDWYWKLKNSCLFDEETTEPVCILPDVLSDHDATMGGSLSFLDRMYAEEGLFTDCTNHSIMMVLQDTAEGESSVRQRIDNFKDLVRSYYLAQLMYYEDIAAIPTLWVGFPMMRRDKEGSIHFDLLGGQLRSNTINAIADEWDSITQDIVDDIGASEIPFPKEHLSIKFHVLGSISPIEYTKFSATAKEMIKSLDTSFPFGSSTAQLRDIPPSIASSYKKFPLRPWHSGEKIPLINTKPFSMTAIPTGKQQDDVAFEKDNLEGDRDVANLQFLSYQLNMWHTRLRYMGINQRMFEEWVGDIWADY